MRSNLLLTLAAVLLAASCGLEGPDYGKAGQGSSIMAITNAEGEDTVLRTGTAMNIEVPHTAGLLADSLYTVEVTNTRTGQLVASSQLLTDTAGNLERTAVAHDMGEFDDVKDGDTVSVVIKDPGKAPIAERDIPITPHIPDFEGHGFQVDEVQPGHVYSADKAGQPVNGFVVGALPDPGETAAPIYVSGRGFPSGVSAVDIYLVVDRDVWQGVTIPQAGQAGHIEGPVVGTVDRGVLKPVKLSWQPTGKDLGPYDILVDVDRNGTYDYGFTAKDASDGEDKVGLTLQYGAAWWRAKKSTEAAKLSLKAARAAADAADAAATKAEKIAKGSQAQAKAAQARAEATAAQAEASKAAAAHAKARGALGQTLADDVTCQAQAGLADTAAKQAAAHADKATKLVADTEQATKAFAAKMKAMAAKMAASHLLVNLAYSSSSRTKGTWANSYNQSSRLYSYVNPPVQRGARHAWVNKLVVKHQSWSKFWNNPERWTNGGKGKARIKIDHLMVQAAGATVQKSCTNSPPVAIINPGALPVAQMGTLKYDIVFDYDRDGYYDIGRDFLDVVAHTNTGKLVSASQLQGLSDDQIYGFKVVK